VLFWEYVQTADDRLDLADVTTALDWVRSLVWAPAQPMPDGSRYPTSAPEWKRSDMRHWKRNLLVLRSLCHRLKGRKPIHHYPTDDRSCRQADNIFRYEYLGRLHVLDDVPFEEDPKKGLSYKSGYFPYVPITRKSYRGLRLTPTTSLTDETGQILTDRFPLDMDVVLGPAGVSGYGPGWVASVGADYFWQCTFCSLVSHDVRPVCEACGRFLDKTKKGRRSRRQRCPGCNVRVWRARQRSKKRR
jgi:hypothetical protein